MFVRLLGHDPVVVVVGPTPPPIMVEGSNIRFYAHRPMVSPHLAVIRARWLTGGPLHSTKWFPTSGGTVHKPVTVCYMFMLGQLNKCLVCGSDFQRVYSGDGCLFPSIKERVV